MKSGVLPDWKIKELIKEGIILNADPELINTSSLDLRIDSERWKLLGSFLPLPEQNIEEVLQSRDIVDSYSHAEKLEFDYLQQYLVKLVESLKLPRSISAKIFNKSGRGRIGIALKGLANGIPHFDIISNGYEGNLYAEISSTNFPLIVYPKQTAIPQIRFYEGNPMPISGSELELLLEKYPILVDDEGRPSYNKKERDHVIRTGKLTLTADIPEEGLLAYVGKRDRRILDLSKKNFYNPEEYYREEISKKNGKSILIHPGDFILIKSKQNVRLPPFIAAEIDEYSIELGDMKSHYAGLVNASHGYDPDNLQVPSYIVFEVRARDMPLIIQNGQRLAKFSLYRMWDEPEGRYGKVKSTDFKDLRSILPNIFLKD